MKKTSLLLLTLLTLGTTAPAQSPRPAKGASVRKALPPPAARTYYLVLLKAVQAGAADPEATATVRAAHMAYLQQLRREGKLALAGSCPGADQNLQAMYLLSVPDLDAARSLTAADPGVKLGGFTAEVYPWVGQGRPQL
jgi:uncharacterized protein YciI